MSSPHLLRPYSAAQLSLVSGDERVAVFGVMGGRFAGPTVLVHLPTARARLDQLSDRVHTVVFTDEPLPEPATVSRIDDMLAVFADLAVDALAQWLPATEALKLVSEGLVEQRVDRSTVVAVRCPEVLDRRTLERALAADFDDNWVSPTACVARSGGRVALFEPNMVPDWLNS